MKLVSCGKPQRQQEVPDMSRRVVQGQSGSAKSKIFPQAWRGLWSQRCQRHRTFFKCQFPRRQWSRAGRGGATKGCGTCLWAACSKLCCWSWQVVRAQERRGRRDANTRQRHPCHRECKVEAGSMCVRPQGQGKAMRNSAAQTYQDRLVILIPSGVLKFLQKDSVHRLCAIVGGPALPRISVRALLLFLW